MCVGVCCVTNLLVSTLQHAMANLVNSDTESALELLQKKFKEDTADELAVCCVCLC